MIPILVEAARRIRRAVDELRQRAEQEQADAIAADLDKILLAADNLRTLLDQLPARLAAAEDAASHRKLRHDLRTPVNQILGYCELLQEEAEDAGDGRWSDALGSIQADTRLLLAGIDRVGTEVERTDPGIAIRPDSPVDPEPEPLRGVVLVVDDNESNRDLLERRLERDGFSVLTASHGREALEICRTHAVDVVLLDIMMPVMDGYETLERLKSDSELRHLPVIMLTSLDEQESVTRCIERGAEDHLPKPFDPVLLRARLGSSLEKKRTRDLEQDYLARIVAEKRRADDLIHGVIPIGVALTAERDFNRLLERVLREARRFCGADGGVLLLRKDDRLEHVQLQCDSLGLAVGGTTERQIDLPALELGASAEGHLRPAILAAREGTTVNVADARQDLSLDLSSVRAFDKRYAYVTRSLLALPLRGAGGEVVGVLELWNATRATDGRTVTFDPDVVEVLESLSQLAGAALESYRRETELRRRIRHLEIRVDEANRRREVSQITETDYFRNLRDMAHKLRSSAKSGPEG